MCTKWSPGLIAKLVNITPKTMVYGTYNYSIHGIYKPTNITGGPHIVGKTIGKSIGNILGISWIYG